MVWKWPVSLDIIFYATVVKTFSAQFWQGDLFPRWLVHMNDGLGSPVVIFYPPLAFYVGALLEFLAKFDPNGLVRTVILMQMAFMVAGYTSYRWLNRSFDAMTAQFGAYMYAFFPLWSLIVFFDFGVTQLWGVALFPLLLEAADKIAVREKHGVVWLAGSYALLAFTHLPCLIAFAPVPLLYILFLSSPEKRWHNVAQGIAAATLGAALIAFFLLPAALNHGYINTGHFLGGNGDYSQNFYRVRNGIVAVIVILPLLAYFIERPRAVRFSFPSKELRFWFGIIALAAFMVSPLSKILWAYLFPLHLLQFPWRIMVIAAPAAVWITLYWKDSIKSKTIYLWIGALAFIFTGLASTDAFFYESPKHTGDTYAKSLNIENEYVTRWMVENDMNTYLKLPESLYAMPPAKIEKGRAEVTADLTRQRRITLHADVKSNEAHIVLRRYYFPGWQSSDARYQPKESKGLLAIDLPKGTHDVVLTLPWYEGEKTGTMLSFAALLVLLALTVFNLRRDKIPSNLGAQQ